MKFVVKILIGCLITFFAHVSWGQNETYLQPFSSLLTINPAFAGYNKNTNFNTGNQHYYLNENEAYNLFYTTYDKYSEKLKGGIGVWFQHGIIGQNNISTTELGFAYSGFERKFSEGRILFSANTSVLLATKQWFAYSLDKLLINKTDTPSLPGKKFTRYYLIKPGVGFLCEIKSLTFGLSGNVPFNFNLTDDGEEGYQKPQQIPVNLSFYLAKKVGGNRRGLKSSPFEATPELIVFYNQEFVLSRANFKITHTDNIYGIFIQNDFTNNIHCLGGILGYRINNTSIHLISGVGIPGISDEIGVSFELALNITIPPIYYSKIKPWAPKRK